MVYQKLQMKVQTKKYGFRKKEHRIFTEVKNTKEQKEKVRENQEKQEENQEEQ